MPSGFLGRGMGPNAFGGGGRFAPNKIAGLALWLKADAITGLADGDAITTWTDSSGNGRNATQATAEAKPAYKASIIGGKPVARFDGGDYLATASPVVTSAMWQGAASYTMFVVANPVSVASEQVLVGAWNSADEWGLGRVCINTRTQSSFEISVRDNTNRAQDIYNLLNVITDANGVYVVTRTPGTGTDKFNLRWNGITGTTTSHSSGVITGVFSNTATTIAARAAGGVVLNHFTGDIAEIIIYDSALSDANRQAVEAYLSAKYGIVLA